MKLSPYTISLFILLSSCVWGNENALLQRIGWECVGGEGRKTIDPETGGNVFTLTSETRAGFQYWRLYYPFEPGQVYEMSVKYRVLDGISYDFIVIGTDFFSHDLKATPFWLQKTFRFTVPNDSNKHYFRLGLWQGIGDVQFSDLTLAKISPVFYNEQNITLGDQERIVDSTYAAHFYYSSLGSNFTRPLYDFDAIFKTNRWDLMNGTYVVYRHDLSALDAQQTGARLSLKINYYRKGQLEIMASRNGERWMDVGLCSDVGVYDFQLPDELFPCSAVYIRIQAKGIMSRIQFDEYHYTASLSQPAGSIIGKTTSVKSSEISAFTIESLPVAENVSAMPYLEWDDYGYYIDTVDDISLWWTDGTRKIGRFRKTPTERKQRIELWMARNEYEPVQFVLSPKKNIKNVHVRITDLVSNQARVAKEAVSIYRVDYVSIKIPTDNVGVAGEWPDPLPPINGPFDLKQGENQPLWILVKMPDVPAGDYAAKIIVSGAGWEKEIPLLVHVWDFTLPRETHLQTAISLFPSLIRRYHHVQSDSLHEILEKYFINYSQHRVSPYNPFLLHPIKATFDKTNLTAVVDFTEFDKAYERYINQLGFNAFRLQIEGLPSGSVNHRKPGELAGFTQGSREYELLMTSYLSQVETHFEEIGALDKVYIYWFDEPDPKDYAFVRETMALIHKAAPKLTRMLTEQPEKELYGSVDLWCPHTYDFFPNTARERQQQGERLWWYLCSSPREPFTTLFIDHYAVEMRTWIWQTWMYGVNGILVWSSNYWTSHNVFTSPEVQNPYDDPMSYVSGGWVKSGEIAYWGNGDGRFLYPPKAVFESEAACFAGPVNSIRWELLREGLEDYEYFWMLRSLADELERIDSENDLIEQARRLLNVPPEITSSLPDFAKSPEPIFAHRQKLAEMIVNLQNALR